ATHRSPRQKSLARLDRRECNRNAPQGTQRIHRFRSSPQLRPLPWPGVDGPQRRNSNGAPPAPATQPSARTPFLMKRTEHDAESERGIYSGSSLKLSMLRTGMETREAGEVKRDKFRAPELSTFNLQTSNFRP